MWRCLPLLPTRRGLYTLGDAKMLRDYQQNAIDRVHEAIGRGVRRPAVVLATGGGKTVVFSHLIPQLKPISPERGGKTLVLAHKEELVRQAVQTIKSINPLLKVDIDMRHLTPSRDADVIVASVPTLVRKTRLEAYDPDEFKTIILDECHHAAAGSWVKILRYFEAHTEELPIYVVGFTATMERNDSKSLGLMFDEVVFERDLLTMVQNKELVDVKFSCIDIDLDLEQVATRKDDYDLSSLSRAINNNETNLLVALAYKRLREQYKFKTTLMFCVDVDHCKTVCALLQSIGIDAQYVTGDTAKHERYEIIEDFKAGKISVLCNVMVFTEGTDIPNIDSLFLARPTKSRPLLVQMIGRGLRLHEGKTHCHIIDIADTRGAGFRSLASLFGLEPDDYFNPRQKDPLEPDEKQILAAKKESDRLEDEMKTIENLTQMLSLEEDMALKFTTYDGFMALEADGSKEYEDHTVVTKHFRDSKINWVRLEYDHWAVPISTDSFASIKRNNEGPVPIFTLEINHFTPKAQIIASNFKSKRITRETEVELGPNLQAVLNKAEAMLRSWSTMFYQKSRSKPITNNQYKFLESKLLSKSKHYFNDSPELQNKLKERLAEIDSVRASNLVFACKYSVTSLWVRWELQKMLGPDNRAVSMARRFAKKGKPKVSPSVHRFAANSQ